MKNQPLARQASIVVALIVLFTLGVSNAQDVETKGPRIGASLSAFPVVKCGGGDEAIEIGEELCYRSRNGIHPQVIVFARAGDKLNSISDLTKKLESWATADEDHRVFVNVLGESIESAKAAAGKLAGDLDLKAVPIVVPLEATAGPETYGIDKNKQVTVLVVKNGRIKHVIQDDGVDGEALAKLTMTAVEEHIK